MKDDTKQSKRETLTTVEITKFNYGNHIDSQRHSKEIQGRLRYSPQQRLGRHY